LDGKRNKDDRVNPLGTRLLAIRLTVLAIPIYLFSLSPTCGILASSIQRNDFLLSLALSAMVPGIVFALIGVILRSNIALCFSAGPPTLVIIANGAVEPYFVVVDFVLLLLFLELSATLASFSEMAKSITLGSDENVSYGYRLVLKEYVTRVMIVASVTIIVSFASLFLVVNNAAQIGTLDMALLAVAALLLVFIVIALEYNKR
jgi:hypothetical protein